MYDDGDRTPVLDHQLTSPILDHHSISQFKPLQTIWIIIFLIFFLLFVEVVTLSYVFVFTDSHVRCDLYYSIVYAEVAVWAIFFIVRFYINWQHKLCLIPCHLDFHEIASRYIEISFYISCIWICVLLVTTCLYIQSVESDPNTFNFCNPSSFFAPIVVVTTALSLQNMLLVPLFVVYIIKVYDFNKRKPLPDTESVPSSMPDTLRDYLFSEEVGFREKSQVVDDMLLKQCDLIRYYKEANEVLNKKIFDLISQGRAAVDA